MSESIRIDVPRRDQLFPKPRFKRITSIVSSCPPVLQETTVVRPPIENQEKEPSTDRAELIAHRFTTIRRLGIGGFGEVHLARDREQNDRLIAIKFERADSARPQLPIEKYVFETMSNSLFFPKMFYFGRHATHRVLAMDLLGPSVEDLLNFCGRRFTPKTISMIVEQVLRALEALHNRSLIHRDLKPENFLFGLENRSHQVHLIDFGLCKNFRHPLTFEHSLYRTGKTLTGTARYCSLHTHHGIEQSRRDDIECLAYIMIYLGKGSLPWMSIKVSNRKKRNEKLTEVKASLTSKELCADLPHEFELFYNYARTLSFTQRPDYGYLRSLLMAVLVRLHKKMDFVYDWHLIVKMFKNNLDAGRPILSKKKE